MLSRSLDMPDGATLHFLERQPTTSAPTITVVLLPSLFFGADMFDRLADFLPSDMRLICPDHRGQGKSTSGYHPPSIDRLCEDEIELIDEVVGGAVHLVGSSMGGYVAMALAERRPDLVATCTLCCCTSDAEREPERFAALEAALRDRGAASMVETLLATMFGDTFLANGGETLARWRRSVALIDGRIADAVHGVFSRPSFTDRLSCLTMPLLLVSGGEDKAKRPADMQIIADRVPSSRHVMIPDAGHTLPIERPDVLATELLALWRRSEERSAPSFWTTPSHPLDAIG